MTNAGDCDDADGAVNPGATEVCDGIDNNCDGTVDEDFTGPEIRIEISGFTDIQNGSGVGLGIQAITIGTIAITSSINICNDGDCDLEITGPVTAENGWVVDNQPASPIAPGNCKTVQVSFENLVCPAVQGDLISFFTIPNNDADVSLGAITDGDQFFLGDLPTDFLAIEAIANNVTESVVLTISGPINNTRTKSVAPYSLFGDSNGNFRGESFGPGTYTATATPYALDSGAGTSGPTYSVTFEILSGTMTAFTPEMPNLATLESPGLGEKDITLFPNPATNTLNVDLRAFAGESADLVIFNDLGQRVGQTQIREVEAAPLRIDLTQEGMPDGVYLLWMKAADGSLISRRFVVNR